MIPFISRPTISIVVINHNYARFLPEAIGSALAVGGVETEVIVVDDGSTDDSAAVIKGFDTVAAISKKNGGALSAVNVGFRHTHGDIIIFLDADDRIHSEIACHLLPVWHSGVAKVQYPGRVIDRDGNSLNRIQPNFTKKASAEDIQQSVQRATNYATSPCSGNAYSRRFLEQALPLPEGRYPAHCNAPDDLINPIAPLYGEVVTLAAPLFDYRFHGGNDQAADAFDLAKLTRMFERDRERLDFLQRQSASRGVAIEPDALLNLPHHIVACLALHRLSPALNFYSLNRVALLLLGLRATLAYRSFGLQEKVILTAFLLSLAAAPRPIALKLIEFRYVPNKRPRWSARALASIGISANRRHSTGFASSG